jgi:hypothetical protein
MGDFLQQKGARKLGHYRHWVLISIMTWRTIYGVMNLLKLSFHRLMHILGEAAKHPFSINPPDLSEIDSNDLEFASLARSALFSLATSLLILSSGFYWTNQTILDGSAYDNSRWGRIGDAYDEISNHNDDSILFLGSSIFYSGIDGSCLESQNVGVNHWNLAVRGDIPYLRLPELDRIISSGVEVIVIEAGPNTFQKGLNVPEARLRWQVYSLYNEVNTSADWWDIVIDMDKDEGYILEDDMSRYNFLYDSMGQGFDELSHRIAYLGGSRYAVEGDGRLPKPGSTNWVDSLKNPPRNPEFDLSQEEWGYLISEIANSSFWTPVSGNHTNRLAFDHILQEIEASGIEVVLLSLPVHPTLATTIVADKWSPFNDTVASLGDERTYVDWTWDAWDYDHFIDPVHFSEVGRAKICRDLAPILESELGG